MKCLTLKAIKSPLELEERAELTPDPGDVVVRIEAAALNRRDYWITQGMYPGIELPCVLGSDGAGVVTKCGEAVDVSDGAALQTWVNDAGEALGSIDILVCNASALTAKNGDAAWLAGFETDIMGTVRAVDSALPWLKSSPSGAIVTIAR